MEAQLSLCHGTVWQETTGCYTIRLTITINTHYTTWTTHGSHRHRLLVAWNNSKDNIIFVMNVLLQCNVILDDAFQVIIEG